SLLRRGAKDAPDGSGQRVPLTGCDVELLPALRGHSIELGASIVFGSALVVRNPATLDQTVKRWIEGSLLDQEYVIRAALDRLCDRMTVRRSPQQRAQNEEIECALEKLDSTLASLGRHSRWRICPLT